MSVEQYQSKVNSLDKDIADLEKKKAAADKKAAEETEKASKVNIPQNASLTTMRSKMKQIENHTNAANKAAAESADYAKKIADKRGKRNDAYIHLQKEEHSAQKKREQKVKNMQKAYEDRIAELEAKALPAMQTEVHEGISPAPEYDVFVSHAWEDKADFVDELVQELKIAGLSVWYDTTQIKWGDSLRKRIDEGLKHSKFGVVVLSPNYIADGKYWTKAELDGLFQLESVNGKTLLPIWHNLTKKQVMEFSPIIASKMAMTTATMTPKEIAEELAKLAFTTTEE